MNSIKSCTDAVKTSTNSVTPVGGKYLVAIPSLRRNCWSFFVSTSPNGNLGSIPIGWRAYNLSAVCQSIHGRPAGISLSLITYRLM
jgi:hypothetical protein